MKKLLSILVLSLLFSGSASAKIGKGEIQLSEKVTNDFIKFLRNEYANYFMVTPDGNNSLYTICGAEFCKGGMGKAYFDHTTVTVEIKKYRISLHYFAKDS